MFQPILTWKHQLCQLCSKCWQCWLNWEHLRSQTIVPNLFKLSATIQHGANNSQRCRRCSTRWCGAPWRVVLQLHLLFTWYVHLVVMVARFLWASPLGRIFDPTIRLSGLRRRSYEYINDYNWLYIYIYIWVYMIIHESYECRIQVMTRYVGTEMSGTNTLASATSVLQASPVQYRGPTNPTSSRVGQTKCTLW